jgi:hypothetical protein
MSNEPHHIAPVRRKQNEQPRQGIVYISPSNEHIEKCAKEICQQLGQTVNPNYNTAEIRYGLAAFLKISAEIHAKHLTKQAQKAASVTGEIEQQSM